MLKKNIKFYKNKKALISVNVMTVMIVILMLLMSLIVINSLSVKNIIKNENRINDYINAQNSFVITDILFKNVISEKFMIFLEDKEDDDLSEEFLFDDRAVILAIRDKINSENIMEEKFGIRILNISVWIEEFDESKNYYERKINYFTKVKDLQNTSFVVMYDIHTDTEVVRCRKSYFFGSYDIRNFDYEKDILFGEMIYERLREK